MKRITIILGDEYSEAVSITAIGKKDGITNIMTGAYKVDDNDVLYFVDENTNDEENKND